MTFHWSRGAMTPRLLQAVGSVVLEWSFVDLEVTKMLQPLWWMKAIETPICRSFDRRIEKIKELCAELYTEHPEELLALREFLERLTDASGKRDDICHGIPGVHEKHGIKRDVLLVPHPSKPDNIQPFSIERIEKLFRRLALLRTEAGHVSSAIASYASAKHQETFSWREPGGWTRNTTENCTPRISTNPYHPKRL